MCASSFDLSILGDTVRDLCHTSRVIYIEEQLKDFQMVGEAR